MRLLSIALGMVFISLSPPAQTSPKTSSALYPPHVIEGLRSNVAEGQWAAPIREQIVNAAAPWHAMDDAALWELMFGATLPRAWMVWSDGHSPITGEPVPMYNWKMDAMDHPWKVQDPTSGEWFPKNDFKAYHDSGLDDHGVFDESLADRALLFNTEHPDPTDPLYLFGVDDRHGYVNEKGERWRFIAAYLIYGQWKQAVLGGIGKLSAAYVVTGDTAYAHKAAILLDRVADLYPTFDFQPQGIMYEGPGTAGYVSTWHDACEETRELALAYDMIYPALSEDTTLVSFLSAKATKHGLENLKSTFADIQQNIEGRILRDALAHPEKIHSNYPRAEICQAVITRTLQAPDEALWAILDPMLEKATAVDGVTGEKGLANYTAFTIQSLAQFLAEFSKADPDFLPAVLARQPRIHDTYRFHIDTLCLDRYYPLSGDTGSYAFPIDRYVGMNFLQPGAGAWPLTPSTYRLLWDLYTATDDVAFAQTLYHANNDTVAGLPYDIFGADPEGFQRDLAAVIETHGANIELTSVNKEAWHLAILRSGEGANRRALWLDYDSEGAHSHRDGMNLGLFAHGLDVLPEMGYPAVQYGGWESPKGRWYHRTAAHNTVLVDEKDQPVGVGKTTLWLDEAPLQGIRAEGAAMNRSGRYERSALLIDVDDERFYVVDVFRVSGGERHTKFVQSHFGSLEVNGITPQPVANFGDDVQTRNVMLDPNTEAGWQSRWTMQDQYGLLAKDATVGMYMTDLTSGAFGGTAEAWVATGGYDANNDQWIPRVVVDHQGDDLQSTFVAVYEVNRGKLSTMDISRLALQSPSGAPLPDNHVALLIRQTTGESDVLILRDPMEPGESEVTLPDGTTVKSDGDVVLLRRSKAGEVLYGGLAGGTKLQSEGFTLENPSRKHFLHTSTP